MVRAAAVFAIALSATIAHAETMGGLSLGANETRVVAAFPGESFVPTTTAGQRIIYNKYYAATMCHGRLASIQETIGSSLHDYTSTVEIETLKRGPGKSFTSHTRNADGQSSMLATVWPAGNGAQYEVNGYQGATGQLSVTRRLFEPGALICSSRN